MRKRKLFRSALLLAVLVASGFVQAEAQSDGKVIDGRTFRLRIFFVAGGDSIEKGDVPDRLKDAVGNLRGEFGLRNFRVISSYVQTMGVGGQAQGSSITGNLGSYSMAKKPVFTDWQLGPLEFSPDRPQIAEFRRFHHRARLPWDNAGAVEYSPVEYSVNRVRLRIGKAEMIGSRPIPLAEEMLFYFVQVEQID